jgi:hypothetical protein
MQSNVLSDDSLEQLGAKPRKEWSNAEWLAFLEGWSCQRLGYPRAATKGHQPMFHVGREEAAYFDGTSAAEASS